MAIKTKIIIECEDKDQLVSHLHHIIDQIIDVPDIRFEHNDPISLSGDNDYGSHEVKIKPN